MREIAIFSSILPFLCISKKKYKKAYNYVKKKNKKKTVLVKKKNKNCGKTVLDFTKKN